VVDRVAGTLTGLEAVAHDVGQQFLRTNEMGEHHAGDVRRELGAVAHKVSAVLRKAEHGVHQAVRSFGIHV